MNPPEEEPYDVLKGTLIKSTTPSEQWSFQQLLSTKNLGDQKPTDLLWIMQQLLSDKADAMDLSLLRAHFLQWLLSNVRMILASTAKGRNLREVAEMANSVMQVILPSIFTVAMPQGTEYGKLKGRSAKCKEATLGFAGHWAVQKLQEDPIPIMFSITV